MNILDQLESRTPEAADRLGTPRRKQPTRSKTKRAWDRENPPTSYRIDPTIADRIREIQRYYRETGFKVTTSQIAEDLLWYALDAWEQGDVSIHVRQIHPPARTLSKIPDSG